MQQKAIALLENVTEVLTGGQAGPGKTWLLLYSAIETAIRHPEFRCLFIRRQTPELADLIDKAYQMYPPFGVRIVSQHAYYNKAAVIWPKFEFTEDENGKLTSITPTNEEGAIFVFGHCQQDRDKYGYGGFEFHRICFDEVANFTESIYLFLFSRLRSLKDPATSKVLIPTRMISTCNPVGVGKLWVKRRFVSKLLPGEVKYFRNINGIDTEVPEGTPESMSRAWLPGDRRDNKKLDESYEANLSQLDKKMQRALKDGLWDLDDEPGQLFSMAWFDHASSGKVPLLPNEYMDIWGFGADYATDRGTDSSVLAGGPGNRLVMLKEWAYTRAQDFAWLVSEEVHRVPWSVRVAIDANGPGSGAADLLESGGKDLELALEGHVGEKVDIRRVDHVERCVSKDPEREKYWTVRAGYRFQNVRAQMYWQAKDDLEHGRVDLSYFGDPKNDCGLYEKLLEEASMIRFKELDGMILIESKDVLRKPERLGRSPDLIDAFVYWNWVRIRIGDILPKLPDGPEQWGSDGKERDVPKVSWV